MTTTEERHIILSGIVGSKAYGLDTRSSDTDRLGIFAAPTVDVLGLSKIRQSVVTTDPDVTLHEVMKWCILALNCNPTVTELVWLPYDDYEIITTLGDRLTMIRTSFLSAQRVRNAYLGYATQQLRKIVSHLLTPGSPGVVPDHRVEKHARHLYRLLEQGSDLYLTGELTIRVKDPERCRAFGQYVAAGDVNAAEDLLRTAETTFDASKTPLPEYPNSDVVNSWLLDVRNTYYDRRSDVWRARWL